ncbi:MAG: cupin domain-containing protein [Chloroflexota bacterium]|nr:cupin domain-containing protein [Chloroflexota bacterium]
MPRRVVQVLALLGLLLAPVGVSAQQEPTAEVAAVPAALREILFQAALEELPPPPAFVRMVRITLQPGAGVPFHVHPGPEFGRIERGTVTVEADGQAVIAQQDAGGVAEAAPVNEAFDLAPGDQIVYPADTPFTFRNDGDEPAIVLSLLIVPAGDDQPPASEWIGGTPTADALAGVEDFVLGQAIAVDWPTEPLVVLVDRLALGPGEGIPASTGPVMLAVEAGQFGFGVVEGQFQISRGEDELEVVATPSPEYRLSPGDAAFFPGGIGAVPRPAEDGLLVLLRLSVVPIDDPEQAATPPAVGAATTPTDERGTPAAGGEGSPAGFAVGTTVVVTAAGVRLRGSPSTAGQVIAELNAGQELVVAGPLAQGDGIVWYLVQALDDPNVVGYVAEDFVASADS